MRRFLPLALPLLLPACNAGAPVPEPTASPVAAPMPPTDTAARPRPLPLKTFGDWAAGCDNGATCQAGSLVPEEGNPPALTLSIERAAGPDGSVTIRLRGEAPALPLTAQVDGEAVARGGTTHDDTTELTGEPALALARTLANGSTVTIVDAAGRTLATLPLKGAAAALRWIDAQQGRDGTTGALIARGPRPDTRPAPALPNVRALVIRGESALLDPLLVTQMRAATKCDTDDLPDATTKPLGNGQTLAIVPCTVGAYNVLSALSVVTRGAAVPATFDAPPAGDAPDEQSLVFNAVFTDGILTADARARGLGDCGVRQRYAWDGSRFRLIEQREMEQCRGNIDYIRTWTARLIR
ncbi:hypothetical protein ASE73_05210 [Sphingomonas sp. Leaf24]|uniref:DUF1176 domain-containing protein n=1 Tax=unclassified Sphingomonas TaxID=196159 RepID=UPI0006F9479B|nr:MULTISPECIES: DUF1176 domain-containing protein [unclassified Sphingomonas]KQM19160.1 hypothetical protein ASE50_17970 [Sphingomonas sp. Leaf5]KQM90916.1 hypothetical protein ASE73_05210 [Sphingomonas sp. Leaf24]